MCYVDGYTQNELDVVVNSENVVLSVCDEEVYPLVSLCRSEALTQARAFSPLSQAPPSLI